MLRANRLILITGLLYLIMATAHIPLNTLNYIFDKNSPLQFVALLATAGFFGAVLLIKRETFKVPAKILLVLVALITVQILSGIIGENFIGSLTGDTGRYAGIASLCALMIVALFHARTTESSFSKLSFLYMGTFALTMILAVLQSLDLISLPGVPDSVTSTFGNLDFFSAYLGTTLPLLFFTMYVAPKSLRKYLIVLVPLVLYCIYLAGAKQGYVDLAIVFAFVLLYLIARKLNLDVISRLSRYSLGIRTSLGTLLIIIWMEIIFISPFLGPSIPIVGAEPQVAIRGVMWLAALNQFRANPILGVGPDQYGYFYEQFRSVSSTIILPEDSSNDAHSAPLQTLATTGILGSLLFMALIVILVRSFFILLERFPEKRIRYYLLALYCFVYFTNAAISPIVLPNKYLFWAVAGYVIGQAYRDHLEPERLRRLSHPLLFTSVAFTSALVIFVGVNFSIAQVKFIQWAETRGPNANVTINASISPYLPCVWYYTSLEEIVINQGPEALVKLAKDQIGANPRCFQAQTKLAILAYNRLDLKEMRKRVYIMIDLAPSRRDSMDLATIYAIRDNDAALQTRIAKQLSAQGIRTIEIG